MSLSKKILKKIIKFFNENFPSFQSPQNPGKLQVPQEKKELFLSKLLEIQTKAKELATREFVFGAFDINKKQFANINDQ